ncbi:MAG TPA: imidazolonepropionase [Gammaproteobacteria bacterium]|nr:imidazolonepropionase [Gammaproteobacteria bacterium]
MYDLIIKNARIYPMTGDAAPSNSHSIAIENGKIAAFDPPADAPAAETPAAEIIDARNRIMLPGFVDCHTHALYAGERMAEHAAKLRGASYTDIARAGGGILSTVRAVRAASVEELVAATLPRLQALQAEGVTTCEIKSGYGLTPADELKMLRAIGALRDEIAMDIVPTFLGAHSIPADSERQSYMRQVVDEMLPAVAEAKLADTADIFCENIAFDCDDLELLAERADKLGLRLRAHTDQLSNFGATRRAAELGALSCDHLEYAEEADVAAMATAGTVAVVLPGAFYFLRETRKPPIELFRQHKVPIALATDVNPGSSPIASLLAIMHMAGIFFGLTPEETVQGVTTHAARALGRDDIGTLKPGAQANFTLWDLPAPEMLCYQLGGLKPDAVYYHGRPVGS